MTILNPVRSINIAVEALHILFSDPGQKWRYFRKANHELTFIYDAKQAAEKIDLYTQLAAVTYNSLNPKVM